MASSSNIKHSCVKNPSIQSIGDLLQSPEHKERYSNSFENCRIISSKYLDWIYFVGCQEVPFVDLLNSLGLKRLVSYKGFWCAEVIRAFYTTLEYRIREMTLYIEVRGTKIVLTEEILAEILGLPQPEPTYLCFTDHHNSSSPAFYDRAEIYKVITCAEEYNGE